MEGVSPRIESTGEGLLHQFGEGGDNREHTAPRSISSETEHPNRYGDDNGAGARAEEEGTDRTCGLDTLHGSIGEGDLSFGAQTQPPIGVAEVEKENREGKSCTLETTDVAIRLRETGGIRVSCAGSLEGMVPQHGLSSTPGYSIPHHVQSNEDGVGDLGHHTGTDSACRGNNGLRATPTSPDQSLLLSDCSATQNREELQRVSRERQEVDGPIQHESREVDAPLEQDALETETGICINSRHSSIGLLAH